jgi:CheY-like chemotaxis protein
MKKILLVAFENDVLESFPVTLKTAGHDVALAYGGLEAIRQARSTWPDLIVMDATLPDMDGTTLMEILHRLPSTADIPTILLKPRAHKLMPASLKNGGVFGGTVQSLNPADFLQQVGDVLAQSRQAELETEMTEETA